MSLRVTGQAVDTKAAKSGAWRLSTPEISVCLVAYNRAHSIGRTIESILAQDHEDFELIISDDASPDETEEVCRKFERLDPRVRYFRNAKNLNMPGNLNAAIARSRAPLVANLHDGDIYRRDLLSQWKRALDENPDAAFVFCALEVSDDQTRYVKHQRSQLPRRLEIGDLVRYMVSDEHCYDSPVWGTVMGRRAAYEAMGGFDPRFAFMADVAMWLRLNLRYPVAYVSERLIQLAPLEADRPHSYVNWGLERGLVSMYEEAIDGLYAGDPVRIARERHRLRRLRDRKWLWQAGSCFRRGRLDLFEQALGVFRCEDSLLLRCAAVVGRLSLFLRRRVPGMQWVVEWANRITRGKRD
jgi:glycosyltransferase involved in cell wall biosynthesis